MRWENLETRVRGDVQGFIQQVLEQEVSGFLGRQKSQRRSPLDARGYRNGYGKPRRLTRRGFIPAPRSLGSFTNT